MKALVVYDSEFGNTNQVAMAFGGVFESLDEVEVLRVGEVKVEQIKGLDLLIVGSPTQRFRPTQPTSDFLKRIPNDEMKSIRAAAFDTRLTVEEIEETGALAFFVRILGYAAQPIGKGLEKKGAELVTSPEGFYVEGVKGPMVEGELERAEAWAREMIETHR